MQRDAPQVVQLRVHAVGDDATLLDLVVLRVRVDLPRNPVADLRENVDLRRQGVKAFVVRRLQRRLQRPDRRERVLQLDQLPRRNPLGRNPSRNPLQVPDQRNLLPHRVRQLRVLREALHDVQPLVDLRRVLDRHGDPPFQQPSAHRRQRAVDDIRKTALLPGAVRRKELQVPDRELVHPNVVVLVDPRDRGDMFRIPVFGELQVVENRPRGRNAAREVVDAEALERLRAELLAEFFAVDLLGKDPFVEPVGVEPRPEGLREMILIAPLINNLFRLEIRDQLVHVAVRTLGDVELARRDVQEGDARRLAPEVYRRDVVVLLVGQDVVPEDDARCHQFDDAPLDQSLDQFRVLQLLADRNPLARPNQLRKVGVDGMVGESGQFDVGGGAVRTACERDAQDAARLDGVVAERLVEVPHAEKQNGVGMHRLDRVILLHQGRLDVFLVLFFLDFLI